MPREFLDVTIVASEIATFCQSMDTICYLVWQSSCVSFLSFLATHLRLFARKKKRKGTRSDNGAKGARGAKGAKGPKRTRDANGARDAKSANGVKCATGTAGAIGSRGAKGVKIEGVGRGRREGHKRHEECRRCEGAREVR